jgi:microcystin-dependent protein
MLQRFIGTLLTLLFSASIAAAQIVGTLPFNLQNGTPADAAQVMADYNKIITDVNNNAAKNGVNADITQLLNLGVVPSVVTAAVNSIPVFPIGGTLNFSGFTPPAGFVVGAGQAISRATYSTYLSTATSIQSVTTSSGSPTITGVADITQYAAGQAIEGTGIPGSTTIVSCTGTSCTLSANASASATTNITVFAFGNGDGSTTFNVPDCRGRTIAGRDNMGGSAAGRLTSTYFGSNAGGLGIANGSESQTLTKAQLPVLGLAANVTDPGHTHSLNNATRIITANAATSALSGGASVGETAITANTATTGITVAIPEVGGGTAHRTVQPTLIMNCIVRIQ